MKRKTNRTGKSEPRSFSSDATKAAFLLGGIGTGNVSIGSRGDLRDWEIFNRPEKGSRLPYTGFYLWAKTAGSDPLCRVLEARMPGPHDLASGYPSNSLAGLPRFERSLMTAKYPFVQIDFEDRHIPLKVSLEAFTPFVPLDSDASSFPAAVLRYRIRNVSRKPVEVSVAGSLANPCGGMITEWGNFKTRNPVRTEFRDEAGLRGLSCDCPSMSPDSPAFGTMALMTDLTGVTAKPAWLNRGWWDGAHDFWDDFSSDGLLGPADYGTIDFPGKNNPPELTTIGAVACRKKLKPGETKVFQFILAWHFPNRISKWETKCCDSCAETPKTVRNWYTNLFKDAWDAGSRLYAGLSGLESSSRKFSEALFSSSLPSSVIDALSANITVLRSNTCFRLADGTFAGWEGCFDSGGCCEGSCTHVWNYAQTLAFLFPDLERTMRRVEFGLETAEDGKMAFRTRKVFDKTAKFDWHAAADGQNGTIIRLYRDWKYSGDDGLVKELWPAVKRAMDYAFTAWDSDGDCVLDSQQHNTYDIEFYGPNSLVNSLFFGALKAAAEMARFMSEPATADRWEKALEKGSAAMDRMLWNGEYYEQKIENVDKYRYQYGKGCLSDQVFGQFLAHIAGLGHILPEDHVRKAVHSVFRYNFRTSLYDHSNVQRVYALNDEAGLLLASWPRGDRPRLPFVYADEVWTGIEYQVASHLIYEGFIREGLTIVGAVRDRHDGYHRNPFNEVECGHHYARSMASWALLPALSGFRCDMRTGEVGFSPRISQDDFSCFFSTGKSWGIFRQKKSGTNGKTEKSLVVLGGNPEGMKFQGRISVG
jgi:uncharacterized protein (DUF608 family)